MTLDDILADLPVFAQDAISVAFREKGGPTARFVFVNQAFLDLFGYDETEVIGTEVDVVHDPPHADDFIRGVAPRFTLGETNFTEETSCVRKSGEVFWASMAFTAIPDESSGGRFSMVIFRDITDLKNREIAAESALADHKKLLADLSRAQQRLVSAIDTVPDPFAIYDADDRLVMWNPAFAKAASDDPGDLYQGIHMRDVFRLGCTNGRFVNGGAEAAGFLAGRGDIARHGTLTADVEMSGDEHFRLLRSIAPNGDIVALRINITEVVRKERELQEYAARLERAYQDISRKALIDELTGLGNRHYLAKELERLRDERRNTGGELAALHIDLDRFKQINDTMGHAAGDLVLREVAKRLKTMIGPRDIAARIGGDEFFVLMQAEPESRRPEDLADDLIAGLTAPVTFEGKECRFGVSVGLARTPEVTVDDLLTNSDIALYMAKRDGRARVRHFEHADLERLRETKRLEDDLIRAVERQDIIPFYQPQVDALTGQVVALEALARWRHAERGLLTPDSFIPVADELGILQMIDKQILETAVRECSAAFSYWPEPPELSFNVSGKRLTMEAPAAIGECVGTYPGQVNFELLESIFFEREGNALMLQIDAMRELGIRFEMDDFGSGNASLVALRRVSPDRMKIDRQLVGPIVGSEDARLLVKSIIGICLTLGIGVTAEGVETVEHVEILKDLKCDRLQGHFFSPPAPLGDLLGHPFFARRVA
ncbi:EAL domain-containing protein [Ovoidimarina sediminis]|uniref:EAL domain-containing protein n=1 Tax=Ovoidimarina sediminis TaxID=3079856 RepID=UPI0029105988|nr:EAL domain-containing protein [Rhodophyticola sp. MJ-SS7]MDU8943728.1 EAL domain-containing protein [Rhodophyticola sp. MJ-SS7]